MTMKTLLYIYAHWLHVAMLPAFEQLELNMNVEKITQEFIKPKPSASTHSIIVLIQFSINSLHWKSLKYYNILLR